jgi:hypothetical protein
MEPAWKALLSFNLEPAWKALLRLGAFRVESGGVFRVESGAFSAWKAGFCFLLRNGLAPGGMGARNGFGSNGVPSHFRKSLVGGSNKPVALALLVVPHSVSRQRGL